LHIFVIYDLFKDVLHNSGYIALVSKKINRGWVKICPGRF